MKLFTSIKKKIAQLRYEIGFISIEELKLPISERYSKIRWINLGKYKTGWFADPFILEITETSIILLVEEWVYAHNKGRLARITIEKGNYKLKEVCPILELDTHLSFPLIYRESGRIYVCPENYQSGKVSLYEYDKENSQLINPKVIINTPLVDVQLCKIDEYYYAFGVERLTGGMSDTRFLQVYRSLYLTGEYEYIHTISNEKNEERGAGEFIINRGRIIRPAQCCEGGYGVSTIFYQMLFDGNSFSESELGRLEPDSKKRMGLSLHTFNCQNNLCVIDGQEYVHYRLSRVLKFIKDIL